MARQKLTAEEEQRLIDDAVTARDSGAPVLPIEATVSLPDEVPLSLRLPRTDFQALRTLAERRGESLSDLLLDIVTGYLAAERAARRPA